MTNDRGWQDRFFESTRGRIVNLLRQEPRTVEELARALDLTDNAVRAHLATLERDGIARQGARRRGTSKPSFTYELSLAAERRFARASEPVLHGLLELLAAEEGRTGLKERLRDVGRRLAATSGVAPTPDGDTRVRVAVSLLNELGGLAEVERAGEARWFIRSHGCPLSSLVADWPEACGLAESLLEEATRFQVREHCQKGERPRCRFEVGTADGAA